MADPHEVIAAHHAAVGQARVLLDVDEVELAGIESAGEHAALVDGQLEVQSGVRLAEVPQDLGEVRRGEVVRRSEAQASPHRRAGEVADGLVVGAEDLAREAQHRLAVVGERHGAGVAQDEDAAGRLLQPLDLLAHGRLAATDEFGRRG